LICKKHLAQENLRYRGTGGISANNRQQGFLPAFLDTETGHVYLSRLRDGRPAPVHDLSGLPRALFEVGSQSGTQLRVKRSVVSGFVRHDRFYSREEAAQAVAAA
jgi:hypothetical protein